MKGTLLAISLGCALLSPAAFASSPKIDLFPTTVLNDLQSSVAATKAMDEQLADVINGMDMAHQTYKQSQCEGNVGDSGCAALKKQIQQKYLEMLDVIDQVLPEVKNSMAQTHKSLGHRLRNQVGRQMTPMDVQNMLTGKGSTIDKINQAIKGNVKSRGLSKRFQKYYELVSSNGRGEHLAIAAASLFMETDESLSLITQIQSEIASAKVQAQLDITMGELSDEMFATVDGVKTLLYGEEEAAALPDTAPIMPESDEQADPWLM
jgi:hypothetical protein